MNESAIRTKSPLFAIYLGVLLLVLPDAVNAQFIFTTNNDGSLNIKQYTGSGGLVVIPGTTNGLAVTSIGTNAFLNRTTVTSVTTPNSIITIGNGAFAACTSLTNITFGNSVASIGTNAFQNCPNLANVTIPDSVTILRNGAFSFCPGLTNITIGNSITNIEASAFMNCGLLSGILFQGNAPALGSTVFANDNSATVYYLPGTSGWSSPFGGRPAVMLNPPIPAGSLQVTLSPAAAITAGMRWQVDGGLAQPNGAIVLGLSVGNHTVSFSPLDGWAMPASQSISVSANSTSTTGGNYYQLAYTTNNGAISITGSLAPSPSHAVVLPGTISGLPVTSIGNSAFQNLSTLTSVTIPNGVTNLGNGAFSNCVLLAGIYFQGNAPALGSSVFTSDNSATVYYLPGTSGWGSPFGGRPAVMLNPPSPAGSLLVLIFPTAAITNGARWQVDGGVAQPSGATVAGLSVGNHTVSFSPLNGWAMPASQNVAVSANAFAGLSVAYGQLTYTTNNGAITLKQCNGTGGGVVLPGSINGWPVTSISSTAFQLLNLTSLMIPGSVTNISMEAFKYCHLTAVIVDTNNPVYSSFAGVLFNKSQTMLVAYPGGVAGNYVIPQSVISIADEAFGWCTNLTGVTFDTNATTIGHGAFFYSGLTNLTLPNSVTSIGDSAFANCFKLASVTLGTNLTNIGNGAFAPCGMTGVTLPGSVTSIGDDAFGSCGSLLAITVDPANSFYSSAGGVMFNKDQTTLVQYPAGLDGSYPIPDGITLIGSHAFQGSTGLTGITIPDSVITIQEGAFEGCSGLNSIVLGANVASIENHAFHGCTGLNSILMGTNVASIENNAFDGCSRLTSITIPDSVITIGESAFVNCSGLTNIVLGTNVTSIESYTFIGCSSLTHITIPDSVVAIGDWAFSGCISLTSVTVSAHVATLFGMVFPNCPSLTGIYFLGDAPDIVPRYYSPYSLAPNSDVTVYYLPWTAGWPTPGTLYGSLPTALWLPQARNCAANFGAGANQFGFNITWASDLVVVVEACTNLADPVWIPVGTNTLTGGSSCFSDPDWTNHPGRYYHLRSP